MTFIQYIGLVFLAPLVFLVPSVSATTAPTLNAYDTEMFADMNSARARAGFPAFKESAALDRVATDKLRDMETSGIFAHIGSDGQMSFHWFVIEGYIYRYGGENLAKDFPKPVDAFSAYMASPTHRANILNSHYKDVGLASDSIYEVIEFGSTP